MLEKIDFNAAKMSKEEYKPLKDALIKKLVLLQQRAHNEGVGVVVVVDGPTGSGRGTLISDLICRLDARYASVVVTPNYDLETVQTLRDMGGCAGYEPFISFAWKGLRARDSFTFYDRGYYNLIAQRLVYAHPKASMKKYLSGKLPTEDIDKMVLSARHFEKQVASDGYIVLKFFLNITKDEQRKRLENLASSPATAWRVSDLDWTGVKNYDKYQELYDALLEQTNYDFAPWVLLNGEDRRRANIRFMQTIANALEEKLNEAEDPEAAAAAAKASENSSGHGEKVEKDERYRTAEENLAILKHNEEIAALQHSFAPESSAFEIEIDRPTLVGVDYHLHLPEGQYKDMLKKEQDRFRNLEFEMYRRRLALCIVMESQDGGGKGGSIRRLCEALDAKAYTIFPSPAPTKPELMHPFLWRYWALRMERAGHVGIYDRSWYGRVLVERVEGFASPSEWARAYDEINAFEQDLVEWGALVMKFWLEIDRDEQLARFEARENTPEKQWKIVDEDWRNRDKYPQYREAIEDMFRLTSTKRAPWHLIEGNDKEYARVKILRTVNDALEKRLREGN